MAANAPRPSGDRTGASAAAPGGWSVLAAALSVQIAISTITQTYPTLAPYLQADLNLTMSQVGLLTAAVYFGQTLGATPSGWATDVAGDRVVLFFGSLVAGLLTIAVALLTRGGVLFALTLVGIGVVASTATPAGSHAVMQAFPPQRRGLVMGIRQTGIPLGGALAAALLPPVAHWAGWRMATALAGGIALVAAGACLWLLWRSAHVSRPRAVAVRPGAGAGAAGAGTGAPAPRRGRLLNRNVLLAGVSGTTLPIGQFTLVTYLILYLRDRFGIPELTGAFLLMLAQLSGAGTRILWAGASDWLFGHRRKPVLLLVLNLAAVSALVLAALPTDTPIFLIALVVILFGSTAIAWQGLYITLLAELAEPGWEGRTVGVGLLFTSSGVVAGPPLFGLLVDVSGQYRIGWALVAAVLALGAGLLLLVRERTADHSGSRKGVGR